MIVHGRCSPLQQTVACPVSGMQTALSGGCGKGVSMQTALSGGCGKKRDHLGKIIMEGACHMENVESTYL